jgi:hypothetical protein
MSYIFLLQYKQFRHPDNYHDRLFKIEIDEFTFMTMSHFCKLDIYYCIIIAWTLLYLFSTILSIPDLPWRDCGEGVYVCSVIFYFTVIVYIR